MDNEIIFKREEYLKKVRGFYKDSMIKVITGIRRCGKSYFLKSIIDELKENGVQEKDIINIELDKKEYKDIQTPKQLEKAIDSQIKDDDYKYLFIDEVENVKNYEKLINSYKETNNISIFITGSNSYLLSGDLATKLTGRYIEIEMTTLTFKEYVDMKKFYNKNVNSNIYLEFEDYIKTGGFPGAIKYDSYDDKMTYTTNVISQIFNKDIRRHSKIRNTDVFEQVQKYIINNFGSVLSIGKICDYFKNTEKINIDRRTIKRYLDILEKAKIINSCELFDIKSKNVLKGEKKYYLSDLSIYFAQNTDDRVNYGPVLENILYNYLKSKGYKLSVGKIGKFECDFIARYGFDKYFYIQVTKTIADNKVYEREYRPFYEIKDMYPRYLFTTDLLTRDVDGIRNVNIVDFINQNLDL